MISQDLAALAIVLLKMARNLWEAANTYAENDLYKVLFRYDRSDPLEHFCHTLYLIIIFPIPQALPGQK